MEGKRSRIIRSSDGTGGNKNEKRKDEESVGLANPKENQEHLAVFRISQLLSVIHKRFYVYD